MWFPFQRSKERPAELDPRIALIPPAEAGYVVIDSELTGLDAKRDSILSLGGVRVSNGRIDMQGTFYQEVRPATALTAGSIVVHGITPDDVQAKPAIEAVLAGFLDFCGSDIIVGHFIGIDLEFLHKELARTPGLALRNPALDTWVLYERLAGRPPDDHGPVLPRVRDPRLRELARVFGVDCRGAHNALADAFITAQVFQRLLRLAARWGIATTGELLRFGDPRRAHGYGHPDSPPPLT